MDALVLCGMEMEEIWHYVSGTKTSLQQLELTSTYLLAGRHLQTKLLFVPHGIPGSDSNEAAEVCGSAVLLSFRLSQR